MLANETDRKRDLLAAGVVIGVAALMRLWGLFHDLPFSYYGDELHFVKRSMALGASGPNPHWFHKPAFLMYVLAFCYGVYYLVGRLFGTFESVDAFGAYFLNSSGDFVLIGRGVVALCGVATAYVVYLTARRMYRSRNAGIAAGLAAAVMLPMIVSSQQVKADVPCGFLVLLSFYWYLKSLETDRRKPLLIAALIAGVAMGTKYYGIILLPVFAFGELIRRLKGELTWNQTLARGGLIGLVFVGGFFVVSPYNFLDPTWAQAMTGRIEAVAESASAYDPDSGVKYQSGAGAVIGAARHFLGRLFSWHALGWAITLASVLGCIRSLRRPSSRVASGLAACVFFTFLLATAMLAPYHANSRHFNAVLPFFCLFLWPGALWVLKLARIPVAWRGRGAVILMLLTLGSTTLAAIRHNRWITRLDSRRAAHNWISENLPRDQGILLDAYGPTLQPGAESVSRLIQKVEDLNLGEDGFSRFHRIRLDLLAKFPNEDGFDVDELAHAWWLAKEATNEELRASKKHRGMGNPLVDRIPVPLTEYWQRGIRYVITNSEARRRYFPRHQPEGATNTHPTWVKFYRSIRGQALIKTLDPKDWGGKGPIIWVYRLKKGGS